jgi:hypothetical protein
MVTMHEAESKQHNDLGQLARGSRTCTVCPRPRVRRLRDGVNGRLVHSTVNPSGGQTRACRVVRDTVSLLRGMMDVTHR